MPDAEVLSAVLLDTFIPLIRVENALWLFPEELNFATVDNRTRGRVPSGPKNDDNAEGSVAKRARTDVTTDGQGTGGRLVVATRQTGRGARRRGGSAKRAPRSKKPAVPKQTP